MPSQSAALGADRPSRWRQGAWADLPVRRVIEGFAACMHVAFIFFACFSFSAASPYDIVAIPTILLWLTLGIRLYRGALPLVLLLVLYMAAIGMSLIPWLNEADPVIWTVQLCYLVITGIFFAMLFSDDTHARVELGLKAFTASCVFSATLGIFGYFGFTGEDLFHRYGRASGTFEDPNVFGSFLVMGALYLMRGLLTATTRHPLLSMLSLLIIFAGIFLSFSRGSWGGTVMSTALMVGLIYATTDSARLKRRIVVLSVVCLALAVVGLVGLLSLETVSKTFENRAAAQDYDQGETGRFGNQLRGLLMLLELPLGMGPLRWRLTFALEPHNSYLGSFANGGWLGGAVFILIVIWTSFVGFRLSVRPSPFRPYAQVVFPALVMFFAQALQIDVEKWRHVYMMLGMVWGLEAARLRWIVAGGSGTAATRRNAPPRLPRPATGRAASAPG